MKSRRSHSKAVLAVAALAIAIGPLIGCTYACPKVVGAGGPEQVNIAVTWSAAERTISVAPDPVRLCEQRQYPVWILLGAPEGTALGIAFTGESPLEEEPKLAAMANTPSRDTRTPIVKKGVPKAGTAGRSFKYDVSVTLPDGSRTTLDPRVDIWR